MARLAHVGLALLAASFASTARAASSDEPAVHQAAADEPRGAYLLEPPRSLLPPMVEVPALHIALLTFDKYVVDAAYAQVTTATIARNLSGGWTLDPDNLWVNYLGHPFHGSLYFNAARSSGLTFLESAPFAFAGAWAWEMAGEAEPPSSNDLVNTAIGGSLFGETLHRLAQLLVGGAAQPSGADKFGAFLLDPLGTFNASAFGRPRLRSSLPSLPPHEGRWLFGGFLLGSRNEPSLPNAFSGVRMQPGLGVELSYGFPGESMHALWRPLEHFDLRADAAFVGTPTFDAFVRGLIIGPSFGRAEDLAGAWGLFANFDYLSAPEFRLAASSLGPGVAMQQRLGPSTRLRASALLTGFIGGVGTRRETDIVRDFGSAVALYSTGPGVEQLVDLELADAGIGALRLTGSHWDLRPKGGRWEHVGALTLGARAPVFGRQQLGADATLLLRASDGRDLRQRGVVARLLWGIGFGG